MSRGVGLIATTAVAMFVLVASAGAANVSPPSQDYGSQNVGTTSASTAFTLQTSPSICTSTDPITLLCTSSTAPMTDTTALGGPPGGTVASGGFSIHNDSCPYPSYTPPPAIFMGPGVPGICQFGVSFAPTAGGAAARTLSFPDTAGGLPATVSLTGNGLAPAIATPAPAPHKKKCKKKKRAAAAANKKCKKKR
jgi:hypothetical protein